jgi:hypothetical protein
VARRPSKKPLVELAAFETKIDCTKAYFRAQSRSHARAEVGCCSDPDSALIHRRAVGLTVAGAVYVQPGVSGKSAGARVQG